MPIQPIAYQETTQFQPTSNYLAVLHAKQQRDMAKEQLESAKMQNRLYAMSLKEAEANRAFNDEIAGSMMNPQKVKDVTLTAPARPGVTPIQGPGGALQPGMGTPSGGINENTPRIPLASPEQSMTMTGIPANQVNVDALRRPGVLATATEREIVPLIAEGKQFGLSESLIRSNPTAAYKYIESKKVEQRAILEKKIGLIKDLAQVNPKAAESVWNSDGQLSAMGPFEAQGLSEPIRDENNKVVGYRIPTGNGNFTVKMANTGNTDGTPFKAFSSGYKAEHPEASPSDIYTAWEAEQINQARGKTAAQQEQQGGFATWKPEEKKAWFESHITQGAPTIRFAFGDRASWNQYNREFGQYLLDHGFEGADLSVVKATYDSLKTSLSQQQKNAGMMGSFVRNLDKQLERVDSIGNDLVKRVGTRGLDIPIRKLKTEFVGSGNEAILEAYTIEISNEIGKLSTGSAASIRELSVEAQARWARIHDPNLSLRELGKVLAETKDMGGMRMDSVNEEMAYTQELIRNLGKKGPMKSPGKDKGGNDSKPLPVF